VVSKGRFAQGGIEGRKKREKKSSPPTQSYDQLRRKRGKGRGKKGVRKKKRKRGG